MPFTDFVVKKQICVNLRYRWTFEVKRSCEPFSPSHPFSLITGTVLLRPRASWCWPCSQTPVCPEWKPGLFSVSPASSLFASAYVPSLSEQRYEDTSTSSIWSPDTRVQQAFYSSGLTCQDFSQRFETYQNDLRPYIEKRELRKKEALLNVYFQKLRFKESVPWVSPPFPAIVPH